jgi:hypothetical protein
MKIFIKCRIKEQPDCNIQIEDLQQFQFVINSIKLPKTKTTK